MARKCYPKECCKGKPCGCSCIQKAKTCRSESCKPCKKETTKKKSTDYTGKGRPFTAVYAGYRND